MKDIQMNEYKSLKDFNKMLDFTQEIWSLKSQYHIGDIAWGRFQHLNREKEWPTAIWESNGKVLGWGWVELPSYLNFLVHPKYPEVADMILKWFEKMATGNDLTTMILNSETHLRDALVRNGYHILSDQPFFSHMSHNLENIGTPELPNGFIARPILGREDLKRRVAVHRAAWHPSQVSEESYWNVMKTKTYQNALDWVIESLDGDFVSYCLIWLDESHGVGVLEPIGTDPNFRGLGLARAVCQYALHELKKHGAISAIVKPRGDEEYPIPAKFYRSLGFMPYAHTEIYIKQV